MKFEKVTKKILDLKCATGFRNSLEMAKENLGKQRENQ